ncbi:MAG: hypothetical protein IJW64_04940 [Clostridia bacterium]|nr:hypothetical protein [Clostridia bacterium]
MKKILAIFTASCLLFLSSCALFGVKDHDHVFDGEWLCTGGYHYKACSVDGCKEVSNKEQHVFENGKCKICDYKQQSLSTTK